MASVALEPLIELDLLKRYIAVRSFQLRKSEQRLWIVNACVKADDRAPRQCVQWSYSQRLPDETQPVLTLNLATDCETLMELERDLADFAAVMVNMQGTVDQMLDPLLARIGSDPAFVVVDPFFGTGVSIASLKRLAMRGQAQTDLLLAVDAQAFRTLYSQTHAERLDEVIGSSLWRSFWRDPSEAPGLHRASVLYRASLQRFGYVYARPIMLRKQHRRAPASHLLFATRSAPALALMSDVACRYQRRHLGASPQSQLSALSMRIHRLGARVRRISTTEILRNLCPEFFGQMTTAEYRRAIRQLIREGAIVQPASNPLDDEEKLSFNSIDQLALFDSHHMAQRRAKR
jgi:hypothetical protein